jgi:hypothetical protein
MPYVLRQVRRVLGLPSDIILTLRKNGRSTVIDVPGRDTIKVSSGGAHGFMLHDLDGEKLHAFASTFVYGPAMLDGVFYDAKQSKASVRDEDLLLWLPRLDGVPYVLRGQEAWFSVKALADLIDDSLSTKANNKFFIQNLRKARDKTYTNLKNMFKEGQKELFGVKPEFLSGDCMSLSFITLEGLRYILGSEQRSPETERAISRLRSWFDGVDGYPIPDPVVNPIMGECVDTIEILQSEEVVIEHVPAAEDLPEAVEDSVKTLVLAEFFPDVGDAKIRITPTGMISIYDVIAFFGYENARERLGAIKKQFPEVVRDTYSFKFSGQGQTSTPVAKLQTIIEMVNVMNGPKVAKYRRKFAQIIVRYMGGDLTLVDEILANHERVAQLPEDSPERKMLNAPTDVETFCKDNEIRYLGLTEYAAIPGLYCAIIGYFKGVLTFKIGCADDIQKRMEQHQAEYTKLKNEDFVPYVYPIYARKTVLYTRAERELKKTLTTLGIRLKSIALDGRKEDTELFTLTNGMSISHVFDILNSISDGANAIVAHDSNDLDHEYRMRQLDVELRRVDVSVELEREKTKQLELQLEILKLGGSLPQMLALAKAIPN